MGYKESCTDPVCRHITSKTGKFTCHFILAFIKVAIAVAIGVVGGSAVGLIINHGLNLREVLVLGVTALVTIIAVKFIFRE